MPWLGLLVLVGPALGLGQSRSSATWFAEFYSHYRALPDLTYKVVGKSELKLDVYRRVDLSDPMPTLVYIHGGGWVHGSKAMELGSILPWLEMGWNVVTVDYRLASEATAPAAVDDCRSALRWVASHAMEHHFDLKRLVISGGSAGGELALVAAMAPVGASLDQEGPGEPVPRPAALVNLWGVLDVTDLMAGQNRRDFAIAWIPAGPCQNEIARRVSPLTYVRSGQPPILTIHGDADDTVPYLQAVQFHAALTRAGVLNQLYTIPGGKHGGYSAEQDVQIWEIIRAFLAKCHLPMPAGP